MTHPAAYPPPAYTGDAGIVSAGYLRPASTPPEIAAAPGSGCHYLATGAMTEGEFGLYRWDMPETPGGPGPHFHRTISESFFILTGTVQLYDGSGWTDAHPGDFLYVAKGGIHAFRNASGAPASMLILFTPGAPREDYFETLADAARRDAMTKQDWDAFFLRHDTFWS